MTIHAAKQYHIHLEPHDIGKYVLLPGDPARSDRVAAYLQNAELKAHHREHRTFTGYYKGIKISVTSTGMGCPSTAIAVEELANIGAKCFIRIGSTGALQPHLKIGDLLISTGSMKNDGTSAFYVPDAFPAVPDFDLTRMLICTAEELADDLGYRWYYGLNATDDAFYAEDEAWINKLMKLKINNVEMESSAIYNICHLRRLRGAMISAVSGNLVTNDVIYETENTALIQGWENEIKVVLETIYRFEQKYELEKK